MRIPDAEKSSMTRLSIAYLPVALLVALFSTACSTPEEATRVTLEVATESSGIVPVTTNLGYVVALTEARAAVENFEFSVAGEVHTASLWRRVSNLLIPNAFAHPGHFQGGDVTGELRGRFLLSWLPEAPAPLGTATLLTGIYKSANFTFRRAGAEDGLAPNDALLGHTALLRGRATKGSASIAFVALLDSPPNRELEGAPFEPVDLDVKKDTRARLGVRLSTRDPLEGDTLFDGIDFASLDADGDGQVVLEESSSQASVVEATNQLRRTFQTHDHFDLQTSSAK